jgi:hypothetical protein
MGMISLNHFDTRLHENVAIELLFVDSLIAKYPDVRRLVLCKLLVESYVPDDLFLAEQSLSYRLAQYSRLTEYERMSLAEEKYAEVFGNDYVARYGPPRANILTLLEWISRLVR